MRLKRNEGFTLLEIIIVIIIVGVLASLALPRFFSTVEFSRSNEAVNSMGILKRAVERCAMFDGIIATCDTMDELDVEDPSSAFNPASHFNYAISAVGSDVQIIAQRTSLNGGNDTAGVDTITLLILSAGGVTQSGTAAFSAIK